VRQKRSITAPWSPPPAQTRPWTVKLTMRSEAAQASEVAGGRTVSGPAGVANPTASGSTTYGQKRLDGYSPSSLTLDQMFA
jgi:hypothetical protein